jgi:hypothetical protein
MSFWLCLRPLKRVTLIRHWPLARISFFPKKKRRSRELRRLPCSINYDANSGSTSHGRVKRRAAGGYL